MTLKPGENPLAGITGDLLDIRVEFETGGAGEIGFDLRGVTVVYDTKKQALACQDRQTPLPPVAGKVRLQILVDRTSLEIFGTDGLVYMPMRFQSKTDDKSPALFARGGPVRIASLQVFELNSAWP
ncbi:MAG: GH32 C-terminal domain-containing protein [Chloroflexi bacterium]|nr:GH32 C-terminal domain-containing protein [Chloroflexota bacterium]